MIGVSWEGSYYGQQPQTADIDFYRCSPEPDFSKLPRTAAADPLCRLPVSHQMRWEKVGTVGGDQGSQGVRDWLSLYFVRNDFSGRTRTRDGERIDIQG